MKNRIATIVIAIILICLMLALIRWKWNECRQVGHGVMYCVLNQGR